MARQNEGPKLRTLINDGLKGRVRGGGVGADGLHMAGMLGGMRQTTSAGSALRQPAAPIKHGMGGPRLRVAQRAGQDLGQLGPGAPNAEDEIS